MTRAAPFVILVGTRPEAIKMVPLLREMRVRAHPTVLITTGQHPLMADSVLKEAGFPSDCDLDVHRPGRSPADLLATILQRLPSLLVSLRPRLVVVQGDTVSALGGALAATYARIPVAHVEAGLRTGDTAEPFPEEHHRCLVAGLACLHFAPTPSAARALRREGIPAGRIHVTGNTGIDAVLATAERIGRNPDLSADMAARYPFIVQDGPPIMLATVHRRENVGARLPAIIRGFEAVARTGTVRMVLPLHPNPEVAGALQGRLAGLPGVHLLPAVDHADMVWLMRNSRLLLTDSGGLQEEAPALGLDTLILREATERMEAVDCGAARLIGADGATIPSAVAAALARPPIAPSFPFGDGNAAHRIVGHLEDWSAGRLNRRQRQRQPGRQLHSA